MQSINASSRIPHLLLVPSGTWEPRGSLDHERKHEAGEDEGQDSRDDVHGVLLDAVARGLRRHGRGGRGRASAGHVAASQDGRVSDADGGAGHRDAGSGGSLHRGDLRLGECQARQAGSDSGQRRDDRGGLSSYIVL